MGNQHAPRPAALYRKFPRFDSAGTPRSPMIRQQRLEGTLPTHFSAWLKIREYDGIVRPDSSVANKACRPSTTGVARRTTQDRCHGQTARSQSTEGQAIDSRIGQLKVAFRPLVLRCKRLHRTRIWKDVSVEQEDCSERNGKEKEHWHVAHTNQNQRNEGQHHHVPRDAEQVL
ncbi:hypothetical protein Poly59_09840 [Rubripirellula reticaptiva]|uniref:Uncharacterized protein n=1 Tax=Rubripirellula reticaptiva TaxID=2528013 RepID=A0A5C6F9J1_9BACT|nr:hypothetical protein Poly59_09840 [Rubripirellula reticaptiva]